MYKPLDKMSYSCLHCNHKWIFSCDILGTDKQVEDWFANLQKEHYEVCETYRMLNGEKE